MKAPPRVVIQTCHRPTDRPTNQPTDTYLFWWALMVAQHTPPDPWTPSASDAVLVPSWLEFQIFRSRDIISGSAACPKRGDGRKLRGATPRTRSNPQDIIIILHQNQQCFGSASLVFSKGNFRFQGSSRYAMFSVSNSHRKSSPPHSQGVFCFWRVNRNHHRGCAKSRAGKRRREISSLVPTAADR
jgi:hypothetical protein